MRALVTGGAGYIGSHMVKLLLTHGHSVTVFDNLSNGHSDAVRGAELVRGDLLDQRALASTFARNSFDVVFHFAGLCYVGESVASPATYYRTNVTGTLNLLDAMLSASVKRLVFSSTCSTFGDPVKIPMIESHPQRPINPYGSSKLMVESILRDYHRAYKLASISLRYFNAAGSDPNGNIGERHSPETHLIPLALLEAIRVRDGGDPAASRLVVNGVDHPTPDGTCIRDYVHVDDLADAHLKASEALVACEASNASAYNLGTGKGHSVLQVIECCRVVSGMPIEYQVGPRRVGDPPELVAGTDAIRVALGWQPRYRDLDSIVATAWRWFSSQSPT